MPPDEHDLSNKGNKPHRLARLLRRFQALVSRDFIAAQVDRGASDVVVGKNIIKIGALSLPTPVALVILVGIVLGVIGIAVTAFNTFTISTVVVAPTVTPTATIPTATPTATPPPTATPLAFATAAAEETLILIATFHSTTTTDTEPHKKIWRKIEEELQRLGDSNVRVAVEPTVLTADIRSAAETLGQRYNASMVIWGEDTGVEVIVNYLNLREPDFSAAEAKIIERERTQLANPSAYAQFVTTDLPGQLTFFALFAVGQARVVDENYIQAAGAIEAAIASLPGKVEPQDLADAESVFGSGHTFGCGLFFGIDQLEACIWYSKKRWSSR